MVASAALPIVTGSPRLRAAGQFFPRLPVWVLIKGDYGRQPKIPVASFNNRMDDLAIRRGIARSKRLLAFTRRAANGLTECRRCKNTEHDSHNVLSHAPLR